MFSKNHFVASIFSWSILFCANFLSPASALCAEEQKSWVAGAAKREITPKEQVRLSGYAVRREPTIQVADPLFVRALAMRYGQQPWLVLVSIDTIGMPASLTDRAVQQLQSKHGLQRRQIAFCSTHTHYAPHLVDSIPNLFDLPLNAQEQQASERYTEQLLESIISVVDQAIARAVPAEIEIGEGLAGFALNRRKPSGPGSSAENPGPVDRTVRVVRVLGPQKEELAIAYQYACHCTTIPADENRISGDWAGLSASYLEQKIPSCIALPIIGCGADANPTPRGSYEFAKKYGEELGRAVQEVGRSKMSPLAMPDRVSFMYVALSCERPSREKLQEMLKSDQPQQQRFAASMLDVWRRRGRIPETYPEPVHLWRFGKQLTWVFLGGEVVVDYQARLSKEIQETPRVWVAGYTDDVFAYVASERLRNEGGYEVDGSMLYYNRPGKWETGTEDLLVGRIREQSHQARDPDSPLPAEFAAASIQMAPSFDVQLMASEPMVQDPINIAFDARGRAWVLEMGDYPLGGGTKGRVKILEDTDRNGTFETVKIFLDNLDYPSGIYPWRDGAVVACAPDLFWARDLDGDDRADRRDVLISGFPEANPQHRVHGFTYGLDHRLHFGTGEEVRQVTTPIDGKIWNVAGCDLSLDVDRGTIRLESGKTQFIRGKDDWGNWFGNDNIHPIFHYVIADRYRRIHNRFAGSSVNHLMHPETAPPVFPLLRDADRFNDVHTANRFTSACSAIVCRGTGLGAEMEGAALVCEPVHNMVGRAKMIPSGATMSAVRFPEESESEWLRSNDPWFRPVRVENAPDGSIWVVDMYRRVIEHPEWIPEDWQARIDLRAGEGIGRVFRISKSRPLKPLPNLEDWSIEQLVQGLASPEGALRDLAQQQLLFRKPVGASEALQTMASKHPSSLARLHAIAVLQAMEKDRVQESQGKIERNLDFLQRGFSDLDARVVRQVVQWTEEWESDWTPFYMSLANSTQLESMPELSLQLFLTCLKDSERHRQIQARLLRLHGSDVWHLRATDLLDQPGIDGILQELLASPSNSRQGIVLGDQSGRLLVSLLGRASLMKKSQLLEQVQQTGSERPAWHYSLASGLPGSKGLEFDEAIYQRILEDARRVVRSAPQPANSRSVGLREAAIQLIRSHASPVRVEDQALLIEILNSEQDESILIAAIQGISNLGDVQAWNRVMKRWTSFPPRAKSAVMNEIMSRSELQEGLVRELESGVLSVSDLDPMTMEHFSKIKDKSLLARFHALTHIEKTPIQAIIEKYEANLPVQGDRVRGQPLFERHCAICHLDHEPWKAIGPNLNALHEWTDRQWLVAVLDPNRSVEGRYRRLTVVLSDGTTILGLLRSESDQGIELALADGKSVSIEKSEIEQMQASELSLMPEGFDRFLSPADIQDIVAYLRFQPSKTPKDVKNP